MARFLYIVSREDSGQSEQVFAWLKRDMATTTVELTFERRHGERRTRREPVAVERRVGEQRKHSVYEMIGRVGWARVRIE